MGEPNCRATLYKNNLRLDSNKKRQIVTKNNEFNEVHTSGICGTQNRQQTSAYDTIGTISWNQNDRATKCKELCRVGKNVNEYYACEYDNVNSNCDRYNSPVYTGIESSQYECYLNYPYLEVDDLDNWGDTITTLKVFKCESCPAGYYQDEGYKTNCKICSQGKYSDNPGRTSDCKNCGAGKYQDSTTYYFQDFETDSGCSDNNNDNCEWGCEARQSMQSYNGANGNLICGGDNRKRGSEMLQKTFNSVAPGYYHLDFDYYKVDSWDGDEYGYIQINDIECWRKTKTQLHEGGAYLGGNGGWTTYAYKASCSITLNTVSNLNIKISSTGNENAADESYGIDNVRITQSSFRNSTTCKNCPVGKFLNQAAPTTLCNDCPAGRYQNEEGKAECKICQFSNMQRSWNSAQ